MLEEGGDSGRVHDVFVRGDVVDCRDGVCVALSVGSNAAEKGIRRSVESNGLGSLQFFQSRFDVWELEEDGLVGDFLVVEHQTNTPDDRAEADAFCAGQIV